MLENGDAETREQARKPALEKAYNLAKQIIDNDPAPTRNQWGEYPLSEEKFGPNASVRFITSTDPLFPDARTALHEIQVVRKHGETKVTEKAYQATPDGSITLDTAGKEKLDVKDYLDKTMGGISEGLNSKGEVVGVESREREMRREELERDIEVAAHDKGIFGLNRLTGAEVGAILSTLRDELGEEWPKSLVVPPETNEKRSSISEAVSLFNSVVQELAKQRESIIAICDMGKTDITVETITDTKGKPIEVSATQITPASVEETAAIPFVNDEVWKYGTDRVFHHKTSYADPHLGVQDRFGGDMIIKSYGYAMEERGRLEDAGEGAASPTEIKRGLAALKEAAEFAAHQQLGNKGDA